MGPRTSHDIIVHFVWTISIAALLTAFNGRLFLLIILFNAGFAAIMAAIRHERFAARKITLWDEALAFFAVFALGHFCR
jgi:hypothetical protein